MFLGMYLDFYILMQIVLIKVLSLNNVAQSIKTLLIWYKRRLTFRLNNSDSWWRHQMETFSA